MGATLDKFAGGFPDPALTKAGAAEQRAKSQLEHGLSEGRRVFSESQSPVAGRLFSAFALNIALGGADAGQAHLDRFSGTVGQLSGPEQQVLKSIMSDARDVQYLQGEVTRLKGLSGLQALLSQVGNG